MVCSRCGKAPIHWLTYRLCGDCTRDVIDWRREYFATRKEKSA
jgi:hypothetical protein